MSCPTCNDNNSTILYKCKDCRIHYCIEYDSSMWLFGGKYCPHCTILKVDYAGLTRDFRGSYQINL